MAQELGRAFKKFVVYPGLGVAAVSMIFTGVSHQQARQAEYARMCKNQATGKRMPDDDCDDDTSSSSSHSGSSYARTSRWYWQPAEANNGRVPKVGETLSGGSDTAPQNGVVYKNVSLDGGSFEDAYKSAKSHDTYKNGSVKSTSSGGRRSGGFGKGGSTGGGHGG